MEENIRECSLLAGEIAKLAVRLNQHEDINVYFCVQGNTGCACLTVEKDRSQTYQRREFLTNADGMAEMLIDMHRAVRIERGFNDEGSNEVSGKQMVFK